MGRNQKRKSSRATSGAPQVKRLRSHWTSSPFGKMLEETGMVLSGGEEANELSVEPAVFQRQLSSVFKRHLDLDQAIEEFSEGLSEYLDNPVRFRMCLLPTKIAEGADVMTRSAGLDSLIRLLLGVEYVQPSVASVLLQKLTEYMDDTGNVDGLGLREYHEMPQLILNQLRWLDHIVKGKDLCSQLLEVVSVAPLGVQREIITSLPEILEDAQHNDTAKELKSLLQTNSELTAAIIDALSNLNIATDLAAEILDVALGCVLSADLGDLPTVLKFIMQQVSSRNALEIISELREKLDFGSTFTPHPAASSTPRGTQRYANKMSSETSDQFVIFDTIRSSVCFQKVVADSWIKAIEQVSESADHRVVDVFVLFILHSIPGRKKSVEALFSNKIRHFLFTEDLMANVFRSHAGALREFFPSILSLCETLLCSSSPTITTFTTSLYQHLFSTFDVYCRQEVIGALITHVGSGMPSEIDHALEVLSVLVEHHCSAMQRFTILIKGVLDYLEHLSVPQIRQLYSILSLLAFHDPEEASSIQDEMHTLIRKQLSHTEPKYRRMGVIGAVMVIHQMARRRDETEFTQQRTIASQEECTLPPARRRQALSMLDDVMQSCSRSPDSTILFCDEMAGVVQQGAMDRTILQHLCDETTAKFQDVFLIESTDLLPTDVGLPLELAYGLDTEEEASIALNLMPNVVQPGEKGQENGAGLRGMVAQFRLMRMCEQMLSGNLEGIDALLGCSIVVCAKDQLKLDVFEDLSAAKRQNICLCLFYCINWFRELVCAFAGETDADMKGKVILRLMNITELQSQLESCMAATPGFWPPCVNPDEVIIHRKGKKTKSGKNETTLASVTCATQNVDKDTTSLDKTAVTHTVPVDRLRPYFRELDLGVFATLHYSPVSRTLVDSEEHTKEREELMLRPPQLLFLLQDLNSKISSTLSAFGSKRLGAKAGGSAGGMLTYTPDQLVKTVTALVPALCAHLENTSAFFQAQLVESDGIVDAESNHQDFPALSTVFHLLLKTMAAFFGWSPLSDLHYASELKESVKAIVARTSQSSSQMQTTLPQFARLAFRYLEQFSEFLPTLTCAYSLTKLLVAVCKACKADQIRHSIAEVCGRLLQRCWRAGESGQQRNEALECLLKYHMEWAEDPLAKIECIAGNAVTELIGEEPMEESQEYPTLSNATLPCYYRCMLTALISQVKKIPPPNKKNIPTPEMLADRMHVLEVSAKLLFMLVNVVKSFDRRSTLSAALKYGKLYVEAFLRSGMPVLDSLFRQRKDDVIGVLKTLQQSTRCLQHFCGHSKVAKDLTLTNHVPQLKRSLEMFLFKVKEMLANHKCAEAFWVGNLKNRDLQGQEILSQASQLQQQSSETDNENQESEDGTNSTSTERRDEIQDSDED